MLHLIQPFTGYIQTDLILTAAKKHNWSVNVLLKGDQAFAEIKKGELVYRINRESISVNNNSSTRISSNKYLTQLFLKRFLPLFATDAKIFKISDLEDKDYVSLLAKHKKLVAKPIDQNNGLGVFTSLSELESLKTAAGKISKLGSKYVLIENFIENKKEYRLLTWKGKIFDALLRIPANVVGDGKKTIEELIKTKNEFRKHSFGDVFEPIVIDEELAANLKKKRLNLSSILLKNIHLQLRSTCNLSTGGEVKRVDLEKIDPQYHDACQKIYESCWINYCGIDLITDDITKPPKLGETVINELNGAPGLTLAFYDDLVTNRPFFGVEKMLALMESDPIQLFPNL